ncbi:MAG: hypothetical protein HYY19_06510 [Candidatus Rokubacteria bacterium]|nr:hypothetical protein [Candidatus Rokubacteria bacterium]
MAVMGLSLDGPARSPLRAVRHTVRVALLDGTELRGAVEGFDPRRPTFRLHPARPGGEPAPRDVVLRHVKKVSFLRDPAAPPPRPAFPLTARLVTVRILDRETIHGVTQGAGGSRRGLFLIPTALDEVERVYVPFSAIRDVVSVERLGEILTQQGAATPAMVQRVLERQRLLRGGHRTPIGQILLGAGALSGPQLAQGLSLQRPGAGRRLGELLVEQGFISRAQLAEALEVQRRQSAEDTRLGAIMVEMGVVTHKAIGIALAIQYQVPFLDLAGRSIDPGLRELVPAALARRWQIVPVSLEEGILTIALADPTEEAARDEIRAATGLTVTAAVATPPEIAGAIARWYGP